MRSILKNNALVLIAYVIVFVYAVSLLLLNDKFFLHIYMNQLVGNPFFNVFFYYITYLGDGLFAPLLLLVILVYNIRLGIYSTLSFLAATLTAQVLKRGFFDDENRPSYIFQWIYQYPIKYVEGVDTHIHNSFPSGHATQAFSILMCLVFATRNPYLKFLFFSLALLTSFSRVYLSQHWLIDITVGSLIGVIFSILFYYFIMVKNKFEQLNKPLSVFKRS